MFDVGFQELLLIFVIGLLILGPERLPKVAAQIGRWVGRARRTANQLRMQLEREIALEEIDRARKPSPKPPARQTATPTPGSAEAADAAARTEPGANETSPPEATPAASPSPSEPPEEELVTEDTGDGSSPSRPHGTPAPAADTPGSGATASGAERPSGVS